jgi:hypothetical protein
MILAGQLASDTEVRRFQAEAEAAANLEHPNILPVYEVGTHQGQHYFSMKLVTGGSLATQLAESPRTAVRGLLETLIKVARAVHFAHQRGVLHRDLKPGNILMDADGTPYVTDFGLAKKVEGDGGLTQSGAVVGTPSYMPPEQARAERALTLVADVYSLGAILYEVLAGRPPFRGASPVETLLQVLEHEPDPPRRDNPAVARDLETVCLKCLEKDPARRYPTAGALADDLERWLAGDAVSARPPTPAERFARWARRNPVQLALAVALLIGVGSAAVIPQATEGPLPRGILVAGSLTAFFAFMMLVGHRQSVDLEKRLRSERLVGAPEVPAAASVSPTAALTRGDLIRSLGRGARNGALLGAGAALSLGLLPWLAASLIGWQGATARMNLRPLLLGAVPVLGVLTGVVGAVLVRTLVRPFGRVTWGTAWLMAGVAVAIGTPGIRQLVLSAVLEYWGGVFLVLVPAAAMYSDWWSRLMNRTTRRATEGGQLSPEMGRILTGRMPVTDAVVSSLPVLLAVAGVVAGHFPGTAAGRALVPATAADAGAEFGALAGRVIGAVVGAVLAMAVLRLYRVEAGAPWPGQGGRPYPRALASLYLLATVALAGAWLVARRTGE